MESEQVEIIETHQRAQQLSEENKTLLSTVRQLRKQIEKLDRQLDCVSRPTEQLVAVEDLPSRDYFARLGFLTWSSRRSKLISAISCYFLHMYNRELKSKMSFV